MTDDLEKDMKVYYVDSSYDHVVEQAKETLKKVPTLVEKFKRIIPAMPEEQIETLILEVYRELVKEGDRRDYAIAILTRAERYVRGYLKGFKIESEVKVDTYPVQLTVKVYY